MPLPCSGPQLPDVPTVQCRSEIRSLSDCCRFVEIDAELLLYEAQPGKPYYWVILHADETPLTVCHLEAYANHAERTGMWDGRRADYLAMGWYQGDCFLAIMELRDIVVNERQGEDKLDQVEASIARIMGQFQAQIANEPAFHRSCEQPDAYKIVGFVIAPAGIRRISRERQMRRIKQEDYSAIIMMVPPDRIRDCQIGWSELLRAVIPPRS